MNSEEAEGRENFSPLLLAKSPARNYHRTMKKDNEGPRLPLGFHRIFTYLLLPLSIGFGLYVSLGRVPALQNLTVTTPKEAFGTILLFFPIVSVVLDSVSFIGLLGFRRYGRKATLFTATFKSLVALVSMVTVFLSTGSYRDVGVYLLVAICSLLVYCYYLHKGRFFPQSGSTWEKNREAYQAAFRIVLPSEKEEEEAPVVEETKEEETEDAIPEEERNLPPLVRDRVPYTDKLQVLKKTRITTGTFYKEEPLMVKEIRLSLLENNRTAFEFDVVDRSPKEFLSAEWLVNGKYTYTSPLDFFPGDITTVKAELTENEDRMKITLLATTDTDGNRVTYEKEEETEAYLPEEKLLKDLSEEKGFQAFLKGYIASTNLNAHYVAVKDLQGISTKCPICGTPILEEERWCPVCGINKEDLEKFTEEAVLDAFQNPKKEESEED